MDQPVADKGGSEERPAGGMPARLSMVVLSARNLPALRNFYRALGWPEQAGSSDALSTFQLGGIGLTLYSHAIAAAEPSGTPPEERSAVTLVVRVETGGGVDEAFSAALRAGAQPVIGPTDQSWGGRSGIVADPEGNRWELLWVPRPDPMEGDTLTPDGSRG